jgi:hypothetical protein
MDMSGYSHPQYASSLAEFGTPHALRQSGGWILKRQIPEFPYQDGMGCYPLFTCKDWSELGNDIDELGGQLVSLSLVTDPFGDCSMETLKTIFDICFLFKHHYVTDLTQPIEQSVRKRYLKYARGALKDLSVEYCTQPERYLSEWVQLYKYLIDRHHIHGIQAFSEKSFQILLSMTGTEMFIARHNQEIVGADIWLVDGKVGYAHLSAISPAGYDLRAPYALYWTAIQNYAQSLSWLNHGGSAGLSQEKDGLAIFKQGWATGTMPVYFCGKVLDREKYEEISKTKGLSEAGYFPAYRKGEF